MRPLLPGRTGEQSALEPAGPVASELAGLFWGMTLGATAIWLAVVGLALYATYFAKRPLSERGKRWLVIGGGVVFPTVVLSGLLVYGLSLLPRLLEKAPEGTLRVGVTAHQWWWRVEYPGADGAVELANEIHLPLGEKVEFELESRDVIHSFWIPTLGGKVDMIPGRTTRLVLEPAKAGVYRGVCAEYCGASHALMSLFVVVEPREEFERWLREQARPASAPNGRAALEGRARFVENGCGACHAVRGTAADGRIGPDLTHVGGRRSIGAGVLGAERAAFRRFLVQTPELKPGVHMPSFDMLQPEALSELAAYLDGLK